MKIGKIDNNSIEISEEARKANLAIFGNKNTGKAFTLIPSMFLQDLAVKNKGITIVVDTPELAWYLYGMCKINKKKVELLKPSVNYDIINKLLFIKEWDYEQINEIYDFKKAIEEKHITIIDMEEERYGEKAVRAASMLLLQLQSVMATTTKKINHSVYIDGAGSYLPFVKNLLKYGDYFGFSTTMFFKSRGEIGDNINLIDNYVRNYMVLQGVSYEDAKYFGERFALSDNLFDSVQKIMDRDYGSVLYEILEDKTFRRKVGEAFLLELTAAEKKEFTDEAAKQKRRKKDKTIEIGEHHYQLAKESAALIEEGKETSLAEDLEEDVMNTLDDSFENVEDNIIESDILAEPSIEDSEISEPIIEETVLEPIVEEVPSKEEKPRFESKNPKKKHKNKIEITNVSQPKGKEPQLNQRIKGNNIVIEKPKEDKYSLLNEFDSSIKKDPIIDEEEFIPGIDYSEIDGMELEDIELPEIDDSNLFTEPIDIDILPEPEEPKQTNNNQNDFDLSNNNAVISFENKKHPYYKPNSKINKNFSIFKR